MLNDTAVVFTGNNPHCVWANIVARLESQGYDVEINQRDLGPDIVVEVPEYHDDEKVRLDLLKNKLVGNTNIDIRLQLKSVVFSTIN